MIPVDFSRGKQIYPDLAEQLKDLDIGILGENDRLLAFLWGDYGIMYSVNCNCVLYLTIYCACVFIIMMYYDVTSF